MEALFLPPTLDQLPKAIAFVHLAALNADILESAIWKIELAVEEVLVNAIKHGGTDLDGIELSFSGVHPTGIKITIKDRGIPFNPLEWGTNVEQIIGGKGIGLIKQCVDEMAYTREGEANVLTLVWT
jgi:anti-sigma regulatory factor (Ser/Thr protein kinase)